MIVQNKIKKVLPHKFVIIVFAFFTCYLGNAQSLNSPDGEFKLEVKLDDKGTPHYTLFYKGKTVIKSSKLN